MNTIKRLRKKILYFFNVFYWFIWYNLFNGEAMKVFHLIKSLVKHVFLKTPYAVIIETSNTCNFQCPTCPTPHDKIYERRPRIVMNLEMFKKIIDNICDTVHIVYLYNSNEPLLNPYIVEMIRYASSKNLHTMISTNCSLLNEDLSIALLNSGLGEIRFALDGVTKESFERFRVGGNFEIVKNNIEQFCILKLKLKKKRPITTLQFILNKQNQDEIEGIKQFSKKNNIDKLYIKPFILSEYAYDSSQIKNLSDTFFADKDIDDENIVYKRDNNNLKPKIEKNKCPDVTRVFTVLADGRAVMCCFDLLGDYVYGDMDKLSMKEIWFSNKAKSLRYTALHRKTPLCKICGNIE